LKQECSNC